MKTCFTLVSLCAGLLLHPRAGAATNETAHSIRCFLFLIDTSSSMSQQKETTMDTVHKLILGGINGRMKPGDVFSIWTFNDRVYTNRYAAQQWIPSRNQDIANRAYRYLRDQNFSRKTRVDLAVAAMSNVVQRVDAITVFLFTDGSHLLKGTPFDGPINRIFTKHAEGMRNAKKPFVTAFIAQGGKLVAHAVSPAGGPVYIPQTIAEKSIEAESKETAGFPREIAEAKQKNAAEQNAPVPPKADPSSTNRSKPLTVEQISALLRESQKKRAAETSTNSPAPPAVTPENAKPAAHPTETTANATTPERPDPPAAAVAKSEVSNTGAVPSPPVVAQTTPSERPPIESVVGNASPQTERTPLVVSFQPKGAGVAEKKPDAQTSITNPGSPGHSPEKVGGADTPPPAPQQTATVLAPEPVRDSQRYLFLGLGLLVVALASAWLLLRNRRFIPKPSLISRSMDDGKK